MERLGALMAPACPGSSARGLVDRRPRRRCSDQNHAAVYVVDHFCLLLFSVFLARPSLRTQGISVASGRVAGALPSSQMTHLHRTVSAGQPTPEHAAVAARLIEEKTITHQVLQRDMDLLDRYPLAYVGRE